MVVPVLVIAAATLDARSEEADELLDGFELLGNAEVAPLKGSEQATRLAAVISATGLDPWDAHVAAIADTSDRPIVTLDAGKWRQHAADLDAPLRYVEITDPDERST